jgi:Flp pilus assembly protein TadD
MDQSKRDAEGGNTDAMCTWGNQCLEAGDLEGAEEWYRRAANRGNVGAMHNLGFVLGEMGDIDGAERWYRHAAADGHVSSMSNLGSVLKEQNDLIGAEAWYRKAAQAGNAYAMSNLGLLLAEKGDLQGAERWYLQAADMGNTGAMHNLGYMLKGKGDLEGAEEWFRRSVEGGNASTMINLGMLRQDRGDIAAAEAWFRRAAAAGIANGQSNLVSLQRKLATDGDLESISFDTFGWELTRNRDKFRQWQTNDTSLAVRFFEGPPDFRSWDVGSIREDLLEILGQMESPSLSIDDLDLPEWFGRHRPLELPEHIRLLEIECFEIRPAQCVLAMTRHRMHGVIHYSAGLFILFRDCFWLLQLEVVEQDAVGEREGAVAHRILERHEAAESPIDAFDPYDRQWDGMVPIEDDPLTRMRLLALELRESIALGPRLLGLEPFASPGD